MAIRIIYKALLISALLMPAGLLQQKAASAECCCGPGACSCCCNAHPSAPQDSLLTAASVPAAGNCSCSSGPNPFARDPAVSPAAADLQQKRYADSAAACSYSLISRAGFSAPTAADRPPPHSVKCLYLLHRSFLI